MESELFFSELLFVDFCALVCGVALSFRAGRSLFKRFGKNAQHLHKGEKRADWYCFFRPSADFRRRRVSPRIYARPGEQETTTKRKTARPRARMNVN